MSPKFLERFQSSARPEAPRPVPLLQELEDRTVLTTFIVNSALDGAVNFADNDITLREAVMAANTNVAAETGGSVGDADGDVIQFAAGITDITLTDGELAITDDVTIDGTSVLVDGNDNERIFTIDTGTSLGSVNAVSISGLTLTGGAGMGSDIDQEGRGGAILLADGASLTLDDVTIESNFASGDDSDDGGGGIYNAGGNLTITNSAIQNNVADGDSGSGGGIFSAGGTVVVSDTLLSTNEANRAGGGIEVIDGNVTLTNVNLLNNFAGFGDDANPGNGGGLHVSGNSGTQVTVIGGTVANNEAASEGGGLWNQSGSTLTVSDVTFDSNFVFGDDADEGGGAIYNNGGTVTVTGSTFTNNVADGDLDDLDTSDPADDTTDALGNGGGILNAAGGNLTVIDSSFTGNEANRAGGAIENIGSAILNNVDFTGNIAGINGGGLHIGGSGTANVTGGLVMGNTANQEGGGFWNSADGTLNVDGTSFTANNARAGIDTFDDNGTPDDDSDDTDTNSGLDQGGGGIYNLGTLNVTGATFTDNNADQNLGNGGGLVNSGDSATATVSQSVFLGNSAVRAGGAIENTGELTVTESSFGVTANDSDPATDFAISANTAGVNGGGLHTTGDATNTIRQSTFVGNTADNEGGGLWAGGSATLDLVNSTVGGNTAVMGGGIYVTGSAAADVLASTIYINDASDGASGDNLVVDSGTLNLRNTVVAGGGQDVSGTVTSGGSNFVQTPGTGFTATASDQTGTDPMLGGLVDNGGFAPTYAPLAGSPLIDAGAAFGLTVDQTGADRTFDGSVANAAGGDGTDIGAVELQADAVNPPPTGNVPAELGVYRDGDFLFDTDQDGRIDRTITFTPDGVDATTAKPLVADWDGDGRLDTVLVQDGDWFVDTTGDGAADVTFAFGDAGDEFFLADFDGDGVADPIYYDTDGRFSTFNVDLSTANGRDFAVDFSVAYGIPGDRPFVGDFDGDGQADLGLYRNGITSGSGVPFMQFFVDTDRDGGEADTEVWFGVPGDEPFIGDVDADGRIDPGVFRYNPDIDGGVNQFFFDIARDGGAAEDEVWIEGARAGDVGLFLPVNASINTGRTPGDGDGGDSDGGDSDGDGGSGAATGGRGVDLAGAIDDALLGGLI